MIKVILFDFDGVIVDSQRATIEYFQVTLAHFNLPVPKKEDFQTLLGLRTIDILKGLLPNLSDKDLKPIYEYSRKMSMDYIPKINLIPNALEILEVLKKNYQLGLVTSRSKNSVERLFELYNLSVFFSVVIDREDVTQHKPHPEGILQAIKKLDTSTEKTVFVGDSKEDIEAAHNAKISCILISDIETNLGEDYKLHQISELPSLLEII